MQQALESDVLSLHPDGFAGEYGCMIVFEEKRQKTELRYKLQIRYIEDKNRPFKKFLVHRLEEIYINDKVPDNFADRLAFETANAFYPLEISVDFTGKLARILNFNEIVVRWHEKKGEIAKKFSGELTGKYIRSVDETLKSETKFIKRMKKDWFLNLYFSPLYGFYTEDLSVFKKWHFPVSKSDVDVVYDVIQKLDPGEEKDDIRIRVKGEIADQRCALDLEQGLDTPYYGMVGASSKALKGTCDIIYLVSKKNGTVKGYEGVFRTDFAARKKITVKMFQLKMLDIS